MRDVVDCRKQDGISHVGAVEKCTGWNDKNMQCHYESACGLIRYRPQITLNSKPTTNRAMFSRRLVTQ